MHKECEICGKIFETMNVARKYCDDCRRSPITRKKEYDRAYKASYARMYQPVVLDFKCARCGKEFRNTPKCVIRATEGAHQYTFCSSACRDAHLAAFYRRTNFCPHCGKFVSAWPERFCSEACKQAYDMDLARQNGTLAICAFCGNEYHKRNRSRYCSKECRDQAASRG